MENPTSFKIENNLSCEWISTKYVYGRRTKVAPNGPWTGREFHERIYKSIVTAHFHEISVLPNK